MEDALVGDAASMSANIQSAVASLQPAPIPTAEQHAEILKALPANAQKLVAEGKHIGVIQFDNGCGIPVGYPDVQLCATDKGLMSNVDFAQAIHAKNPAFTPKQVNNLMYTAMKQLQTPNASTNKASFTSAKLTVVAYKPGQAAPTFTPLSAVTATAKAQANAQANAQAATPAAKTASITSAGPMAAIAPRNAAAATKSAADSVTTKLNSEAPATPQVKAAAAQVTAAMTGEKPATRFEQAAAKDITTKLQATPAAVTPAPAAQAAAPAAKPVTSAGPMAAIAAGKPAAKTAAAAPAATPAPAAQAPTPQAAAPAPAPATPAAPIVAPIKGSANPVTPQAAPQTPAAAPAPVAAQQAAAQANVAAADTNMAAAVANKAAANANTPQNKAADVKADAFKKNAEQVAKPMSEGAKAFWLLAGLVTGALAVAVAMGGVSLRRRFNPSLNDLSRRIKNAENKIKDLEVQKAKLEARTAQKLAAQDTQLDAMTDADKETAIKATYTGMIKDTKRFDDKVTAAQVAVNEDRKAQQLEPLEGDALRTAALTHIVKNDKFVRVTALNGLKADSKPKKRFAINLPLRRKKAAAVAPTSFEEMEPAQQIEVEDAHLAALTQEQADSVIAAAEDPYKWYPTHEAADTTYAKDGYAFVSPAHSMILAKQDPDDAEKPNPLRVKALEMFPLPEAAPEAAPQGPTRPETTPGEKPAARTGPGQHG